MFGEFRFVPSCMAYACVLSRHQVFNRRNEMRLPQMLGHMLCLSIARNDVTNVCLTGHICNTIDFAFVVLLLFVLLFFRFCWQSSFLCHTHTHTHFFPLCSLHCLCQMLSLWATLSRDYHGKKRIHLATLNLQCGTAIATLNISNSLSFNRTLFVRWKIACEWRKPKKVENQIKDQ